MRAVARSVRAGAMVLVGAFSLLALAVTSASASKGVVSIFGSSGSGAGQFANALATAVHLSSGDVYVIDQGNNRIEQFDASGTFVRAFGWGVADGNAAAENCTSGCQPGIAGSGDGQFDGPQGIAIDQSDGSVYVVDGNNNRVEKFDSSGTYVSQFGSSGSAESQFSGPQGIAVDPSDRSVYVVDAGGNRVDHFDQAGAFVDMFGAGVADGTDVFEVCTSSCQPGIADGGDGAFSFPIRVAVDSTGKVYVLDAGNGRIERFTAADAFDEQFDPTDVFAPQEIAIGPGNDHLYVAQWAQDFSEQHVVEIAGSGTLVDTHGVGSGESGSSGLAVGPGDQKLYLADDGNARVFILDEVTPPTVSINPATNVTSDGADVSGTINPNGAPAAGWHFETSTDDVNWTPAAADQHAGSGTSDVPVSATLSGLVPNTAYFVRLAGTRPFNAPVASSEIQLTTPAAAPAVVTEAAQDHGPTHATFRATLNARNSSTTYFFEYGTTAGYGHRFPVADVNGGSSNDVTGALQRIDGLSPGTAYHYRIVATNQAGTSRGQDQTFTTTSPPAPSAPRAGIPGAGFLPDNRGWELVSPADKGGNDVMGDTSRTRAAADGSAAQFDSLGGFGDTQGTGVAVEYMSVRNGQPGTSGWSTHAISPPANGLAFQWALSDFDPRYEGELSPDLSRGVFRTASPLTGDPSTANVGNLFLRTDLRSPGAGADQLVTACPVCTSPLVAPLTGQVTDRLPRVAGASADFGHVLFESAQKLTPDATADGSPSSPVNLYEWDHRTVRLAGILPDGSPAAQSEAGPGAVNQVYMPRVISADGSRIFFTDTSSGGLDLGALYMRVDHATTVQINASERTDCADHDPCNGTPEADPNGQQPARFWNASADGTRAFFISTEALTDDAAPGQRNIYMYDASLPSGHRLRAIVPHDVEAVIGTSNDGHYVYFLAFGQLVAGQPVPSSLGFYLWHDGSLSYIGELADPAKDSRLDEPLSWGFSDRFAARVTPDGKHLLLTSGTARGLAGYDHGSCSGNGCEELYLYSTDTGVLRCASCNPTGAPGAGDALDNHRLNVSGTGTTWHVSHAVSDDGRRVFFDTTDALVPEDSNGKSDVYEYDVPSGTVHLISSGRDPSASYFMDASTSGDDVFFRTRAQLVGWDTDQNYDLYDARVGGGLPDPAAPAPGCTGDACQGALGAAPSAGPIASASPSGSGNVAPVPRKRVAKPAKRRSKPIHCRRGTVRGKVKGKVRCIKPARHHANKTVRHAKKTANRGHGRAK